MLKCRDVQRPEPTKIIVFTRPIDMRKGFNGLHTLVKEELNSDPLSGWLFVLMNKARNRVKILHWDGSGLRIFAKRLEQGRFSRPVSKGGIKLQIEP